MTTFQRGDRVRAKDSVQGLEKGRVYEVAEVRSRPYPFGGDLVTYCLRRPAPEPSLQITNGHLILEKAD